MTVTHISLISFYSPVIILSSSTWLNNCSCIARKARGYLKVALCNRNNKTCADVRSPLLSTQLPLLLWKFPSLITATCVSVLALQLQLHLKVSSSLQEQQRPLLYRMAFSACHHHFILDVTTQFFLNAPATVWNIHMQLVYISVFLSVSWITNSLRKENITLYSLSNLCQFIEYRQKRLPVRFFFFAFCFVFCIFFFAKKDIDLFFHGIK